MKNPTLRKVLISLIFGIVSSMIQLYIALKDIFQYIIKTEFPLFLVLLLQTVFFSSVFLFGSLLLQLKRENVKEGSRFKKLKISMITMQVLSVFPTVTIFYLPVLGNFYFIFSILLLCIGVYWYYKTKTKLSVSFIVWGGTILFLDYLMMILVYGFENCVVF